MPANVKNRLLLALPRREADRLAPQLEYVETRYKEILADEGSSLEYVYFPNSGVISVLGVFADGDAAEVATIGREGATGFQEILGARSSNIRLLVQIEGSATRMKRNAFDRAVRDVPPFKALMFAYLHAFLQQVMVSAACNGVHNVRERLARWLLMMRDRNDGDTMLITQDLLAEMLGVHRPTITKAIRPLVDEGAIRVGRRYVEVLDRDRLLDASCECYLLARSQTSVLLPKSYPV